MSLPNSDQRQKDADVFLFYVGPFSYTATFQRWFCFNGSRSHSGERNAWKFSTHLFTGSWNVFGCCWQRPLTPGLFLTKEQTQYLCICFQMEIFTFISQMEASSDTFKAQSHKNIPHFSFFFTVSADSIQPVYQKFGFSEVSFKTARWSIINYMQLHCYLCSNRCSFTCLMRLCCYNNIVNG